MSKADDKKNAREATLVEGIEKISSRNELKTFLSEVKERLADKKAAPIHVASSMQYVFTLHNVDELMDKANLELAREIWGKLKEAGMQLHNPPLLFPDEARVQ